MSWKKLILLRFLSFTFHLGKHVKAIQLKKADFSVSSVNVQTVYEFHLLVTFFSYLTSDSILHNQN